MTEAVACVRCGQPAHVHVKGYGCSPFVGPSTSPSEAEKERAAVVAWLRKQANEHRAWAADIRSPTAGNIVASMARAMRSRGGTVRAEREVAEVAMMPADRRYDPAHRLQTKDGE